MKTKKLVELLQKIDPSGEGEVCVGNCDIVDVYGMPAYYDGAQQILIRDETKTGYNIKGVKFIREGTKIQIETVSVYDLLWDNTDIEISGASDYQQKLINTTIKQVHETNDKINVDSFIDWCKKHFQDVIDYPLTSQDIFLFWNKYKNFLNRNDFNSFETSVLHKKHLFWADCVRIDGADLQYYAGYEHVDYNTKY
jgi:hypothetical protein